MIFFNLSISKSLKIPLLYIMSVYLQFDSSSRSNPYIQKDISGAPVLNVWVPNDNYSNSNTTISGFQQPYQTDPKEVQSTTNYSVYYRELNDANNIRTIGFLAHCRERPVNLTYSVECCVVTVPASAVVPRIDDNGNVTYVSVLNEPYLYVRMMPIEQSEGKLIYSNNPGADDATFIVWHDKTQIGITDSPAIMDPIPRPNPTPSTTDLNAVYWIIYKTCMFTVMRLNLQSDEWQIRIYDRFGNDVIAAESDNGGAGFNQTDPPVIDPNLQTSLLVGIKPNYPL
jgi:hypothetical protein